jgi:hypothetical protein
MTLERGMLLDYTRAGLQFIQQRVTEFRVMLLDYTRAGFNPTVVGLDAIALLVSKFVCKNEQRTVRDAVGLVQIEV